LYDAFLNLQLNVAALGFPAAVLLIRGLGNFSFLLTSSAILLFINEIITSFEAWTLVE